MLSNAGGIDSRKAFIQSDMSSDRHLKDFRACISDLQFRPRCKGCNRCSGFRITIFDARSRGNNSKPQLER